MGHFLEVEIYMCAGEQRVDCPVEGPAVFQREGEAAKVRRKRGGLFGQSEALTHGGEESLRPV